MVLYERRNYGLCSTYIKFYVMGLWVFLKFYRKSWCFCFWQVTDIFQAASSKLLSVFFRSIPHVLGPRVVVYQLVRLVLQVFDMLIMTRFMHEQVKISPGIIYKQILWGHFHDHVSFRILPSTFDFSGFFYGSIARNMGL